ncbi:MAG: diaminopimelate epimerase [Burkholderiaceae bacterium]|uniref:diaminopimelate epimerase n=1 Tax=Ottowia sp. TaxID=1898956 RepID=UPI002CDC6C58|nr:diaminopimelate epimerase [Ottowia sp.]MCP5259137.1 diaminopimelate epimerase [Burkholderiaceae bacterium]HRW72829.1 diaminopimelate epimerase [Ottowia sp.]
MRIPFTKMQGAGNDFVVLDETAGPLGLTAAQYRFLGDRHFGVGADQILGVRAAPTPDVDFEYVIHNGGDGGEVEHCGNGARCFVRFVRERGLTAKRSVRVKVKNGVLELTEGADGRVTVDMGAPVFALEQVPFDPRELEPVPDGHWQVWPLPLEDNKGFAYVNTAQAAIANVAVLSMGNPHAVQIVADVDTAPVATQGPLIERHPAFPNRVNAGFMQIVGRGHVRLRVYERGAGETLACGTGACAAVVAGIRLGRLDPRVDVDTRGGRLTIAWAGGERDPVLMIGPATTVFTGEIEVPQLP